MNRYSFQPGSLVVHPDKHAWGVGQVQSIIGNRATVNFEHAGKRVINMTEISLSHLPERFRS